MKGGNNNDNRDIHHNVKNAPLFYISPPRTPRTPVQVSRSRQGALSPDVAWMVSYDFTGGSRRQSEPLPAPQASQHELWGSSRSKPPPRGRPLVSSLNPPSEPCVRMAASCMPGPWLSSPWRCFLALVLTSPRAEDRCGREWCPDGEAGPEPVSTDPVAPAPGVVGGQGADGQW